MSWHTVIYRNANASATADTAIAAVTDGVLRVSGNNFFLPNRMRSVYAYAGGDELLRASLNAPGFNRLFDPRIRPVQAADDPPTDPNVMDLSRNPIEVQATDELGVVHTGSGATAPVLAVVGLQDQFRAVPQGDAYTLRLTGTTTLTANAWTIVTLTPDTQLPPGRYSVIGCEFFSAAVIAGRLLFRGEDLRPGGVGIQTETDRSHRMFSDGRLGMWGEFTNDDLPRCEYYSNSADTAESVYMRIVRVGSR